MFLVQFLSSLELSWIILFSILFWKNLANQTTRICWKLRIHCVFLSWYKSTSSSVEHFNLIYALVVQAFSWRYTFLFHYFAFSYWGPLIWLIDVLILATTILPERIKVQLIYLFIIYFVADVCSMTSESRFAVLALFSYSDKSVPTEKDGMVLLFDVENPIPVSTWFVRKVLVKFCSNNYHSFSTLYPQLYIQTPSR